MLVVGSGSDGAGMPSHFRYRKAVFVQYTDSSFSVRSSQPTHMGLLGPTIVLEPGDTLEVVLQNHLPFDVNFDPEGGLASVSDSGAGQTVQPGASFSYRWIVPAEVSS